MGALRILGLMLLVSVLFSTQPVIGAGMPPGTDIVVAKDGSGDFTTVQEAVDAAPSNSTGFTLIYIKEGIYEEYVNVAADKRNLVLYGESSRGVIITYKPTKDLNFTTLVVNAPGFIAYNLTLENTGGPTFGPAQALLQGADKSIYINCRVIGNQDTYLTGRVRSYNRNCYYEGTVDFIFGDGAIVFENCDIYSKGGSAITAASTREYSEFGYVFRDCRVVSKKGTSTHLGRPWKDYAAVAFINCELPAEVNATGWHNWDHPEREETSRYAEYGSYGPGARPESRVDWATMLTDEEVKKYNTLNVLKSTYSSSPTVDNWNPYEVLNNSGIPGLSAEGDGFGMNEGGNGGETVVVDNETDLKQYASSASKYIVQIEGNIQLSGSLDVGSNTTIMGIDETSGVTGAALSITNKQRNVIIKNLTVSNPDGNGISVSDGHNVFITHVTFIDCGEGSCDINQGSDSVTVSWCKFYYPEQEEHRFTMIADGHMTWDDSGNVIAYGDKLNVTLHHNWWYTGADQRMPAATNTNAHIYNNYWNCVGNSYCSNARANTGFYSENNFYDNVSNPNYAEDGGKIFSTGNIYNQCTGDIADGTDDVFATTYTHMPTAADDVPLVVTSRAGNTWGDPQRYTVSTSLNGWGHVAPGGENFYNDGQLVTLEASPRDGYAFVGWSGDVESSDNPLVFAAEEDLELVANFEEVITLNSIKESEYLIFPNPSGGKFEIKLRESQAPGALVKIYGLTGNLLYEKRFIDERVLVSSQLKPGLYSVQITSDNLVSTQLMVIK